MGAALGISASRQAYPAIYQDLAKDGQARDIIETLDHTHARQLRHTWRTKEMN